MERTEVILVDTGDNETGTIEKIAAHEQGLLHRAFSIFIFDTKGRMLLQQRAKKKYHSPGLWTNACCSHPQPGEEIESSALQRLEEELGFQAPIRKIFDFVYHTKLENGLIEHEFDHVFTGEYEGKIDFNKEEVMDIAYKPVDEVETELSTGTVKYTAWFQLAFPRIKDWWEKQYGGKR